MQRNAAYFQSSPSHPFFSCGCPRLSKYSRFQFLKVPLTQLRSNAQDGTLFVAQRLASPYQEFNKMLFQRCLELYYHRGRARDPLNWWSLWDGQQVVLGGKKLIIFTVQSLLNMFLSGMSLIHKQKYVERDEIV